MQFLFPHTVSADFLQILLSFISGAFLGFCHCSRFFFLFLYANRENQTAFSFHLQYRSKKGNITIVKGSSKNKINICP